MSAKTLKILRKKTKKLKKALVLAMREVLALLHVAGLCRRRYANLVFGKTMVMRMLRTIKIGVKDISLFAVKATAMSLVAVIIFVPLLQAFEAHVINVTATPIQIDPPVLTIPGDIGWDNPVGGVNLTGNQDIVMSDADTDATHIYYTYGAGTDPSAISDPVCGESLGGPKGDPQQVSFSSDTVVKAIACDGSTSSAHKSVVNTKIYTFSIPCQDRFVPLDVMMVLDRSGSMEGAKIAAAKTASKNFLDNLSPARDQSGLVSFSDSATLDEQLTNDFVSVKTAIDGLSAGGSTNIGDGLDKANTELSSARAQSGSTKVEILLTDGRANRPGSGDDNPTAVALAQAEADEAAQKGFLLFTIGLGTDVNEPFLQDLANRTGGEYFFAPDETQLDYIYNQIAHLLCGNGKISGYKYHDLNQDGIWATSTEPAIPGWKITLKRGNGIFGTTYTNAEGYYEFSDLPANMEFTVIEEARAGWQATNPASGQLTITLTVDGQYSENNNFGNYDTGQQCVPVPVTFPSNLAVLVAGDTSGNDDILVDSNVTVNGDVRSNDDINADGNGTNRFINGSAYAGDDVEQANFTFGGGGTYHENYPTTILPLSQSVIDAFKDNAKTGGTINGSLEFPNNTTGLELGPSEILGNLEFGNSNVATIKGPLYIHGNLVIGQHTTITEHSSFGDLLVPIIVGGTIDVGNNVTFNGSGTKGGFLLISTHAAVSGDNAAIDTSSNNSDLGDAVLYASEGDVHIRSNRTLLAIYAKHGTGSDNPAIRLDSNVTVTWRLFGTEIGCGPRFTPLDRVLINEFMVNPSGNDNDPMPNGEWVELYNGSTTPVDVNGWYLYDNDNSNELEITSSKIIGGNTVIPPGGLLVVYRNGDNDFNLNNSSSDMVRLYNDAIGSGGVLIDSYAYDPPSGGMPTNKSITRMPDGTANWVDPEPTPGEPNNEFINPDITPSEPIVYEVAPEPPVEEILQPQPGESDYIAPEEPPVVEEPTAVDQPVQTDVSTTETATTTDQPATENAGGGSAGSANSDSLTPVTETPLADVSSGITSSGTPDTTVTNNDVIVSENSASQTTPQNPESTNSNPTPDTILPEQFPQLIVENPPAAEPQPAPESTPAPDPSSAPATEPSAPSAPAPVADAPVIN